MKLSDIMSAAGLAIFAEAALVLFMAVFVAVCVSVFRKKNGERLEAARFLPLEETALRRSSSALPEDETPCPDSRAAL